ncbi:hypothetical protein C3495_05500 [Clostridiaceae bacterium 14S0207]|nr:hypothetical protein C3495_05500 [Clostridiaceae bacterium 14S0207]
MNIEKILKEYKTKKAYVDTTLARIEQYKYAIAHPEEWYKDYVPKSSPLGMPGRPKGSYVGSVSEEYMIDKELNKHIIEEWIREDQSRIFFKKLEIEQIDKAINGCLNEQEKLVIKLKYLEGMYWKDVEFNYNSEFRQRNYVTYETLKKNNRNILKRLTDILEPFYSQYRVSG